MENTSTAITDRAYFGAEGVREWIRDMFEGFDAEAQYEVEEILADSEDLVAARYRLVVQGARSGAPLTLRWTAVSWYRDGKATS